MAHLIRRGLQEDGYAVEVASTGPDAVWHATEFDYDAVVLDRMLPGFDGLEACRQLRAARRWAPVLMLTARDGIDDRVAGLDAGADDYLVKPFSFAELSARLRALMRRGSPERPVELAVGGCDCLPRPACCSGSSCRGTRCCPWQGAYALLVRRLPVAVLAVLVVAAGGFS